MTKEAKRIGRPMNAPPRGKQGKRVSLGLKVTPEMKRRIDTAALASGRTQSQEAEALMERAITYDAMLDAMNMTIADIKQGRLENALREAGFTAVRSDYGKVWYPPGHPTAPPRSGFISPEDDQ